MFLFYAYFGIASAVLMGGTVLYYVLFPEVAAERFGERKGLPPDVGIWRADTDTPEAIAARARGLVREVRTFYQEDSGVFRGGRLLRQARLRDVETNDIVSVEPDTPIKRRRVARL